MPETPATLAVLVILANNYSTQNIAVTDALHLARVLSSAAVEATPAAPVTIVEDHAWRVSKALANPEVQQAYRDGKKITAIKALRTEIACGLKEAKDAVDAAFPGEWVTPESLVRRQQRESDEALAALRAKLTGTPPVSLVKATDPQPGDWNWCSICQGECMQ